MSTSLSGRPTVPKATSSGRVNVAGAVVYLLSDLAAWVTGQVLAVDGGASAKPSYLDGSGLPVFVSDPALRAKFG